MPVVTTAVIWKNFFRFSSHTRMHTFQTHKEEKTHHENSLDKTLPQSDMLSSKSLPCRIIGRGFKSFKSQV